nr:MAG TPA: Nucleoside 2-deoxyribosyltransferase like protein [Caudoviricetes sp.]
MKWYYISHPYTGNEEENRKKAADVQRHLHEMYADIMCINPLAMFAPLAALSYEKIMTYCLEVMQPADAVIMCKGYEKSRGCMREYEAAKQGGKTILFYEGGDAPLVDIEEHEEGDKVQEIDMTRPQPCTKYRDAERMAWIAKLIEETHEVVQEAQIVAQLEKADEEALSTVLWEARKRLAMELTDVKTLCESWLYAEGWDEEERDELQRLVNEKNRERGYF